MKILKFSLPTCTPCLVLSKQMEGIDLTGYEVEDVNIRHNNELKEKYNIKSVPTLVILDNQGQEVERIRNIVQLKKFLETKPFPVFETPTEKIKNVNYIVGFDDYKEEIETSWIDKIKKLFN